MESQSTTDLEFVLEAEQGTRSVVLAAVTDLEAHPFDLIDGSAKPSAPRIYRVVSGDIVRDLSYSTDLTMVISDRAVRVLEEAGLRGWTRYPASLVDRNDRSQAASGLVVLGRCEIAREGKGGKRPFGPSKLNLIPGSWDGSDFAVANGTAVVLTTDRVRRAIGDAGLTGFSFLDVSTVEYPI
jgi:hypothetical protein